MAQNLRSTIAQKTNPGLRMAGKVLATAFFLASVGVLRIMDESQAVFRSGDFIENLKDAASGDKLCYIAFYTEYCYPCDLEMKKIMSSRRLKGLLSENFVATRMDIMDQAEGSRLTALYQVTAIPTMIITDSEGYELDRCHSRESESNWAGFLEKTDGLRIAPEITLVSDNEGNNIWQKTHAFGIVVGEDLTYARSRLTAEKLSQKWKDKIWIVPGEGKNFYTVVGAFSKKSEAEAFGKAEGWEKSKIIRLSDEPVRYGN
ncbi:MAG: hypothetical protein R3C61_08430 [Bacteroidia bacterium]